MAQVWDGLMDFVESYTIAHPVEERDMSFFLNWAHPWAPWVSSLLYLLMVFTLPKILANQSAIRAKPIVALWNLGLSIFSFFVLIGVGVPYFNMFKTYGIYNTFVGTEDYYFSGSTSMLFWTYVFCLSKFAELVDTLFLIIRKRKPQFLHWFHHATVLLYTWYCSYTHTCLGFNFVVMNAFVHTFMYFYYFLSEIGYKPPEFVALFITIIQISQMLLGVAVVVFAAYFWYSTGIPFMSDDPELILICGLAMYGIYLFLFCQFFVGRYLTKKPAAPAKGKGKNKSKKQ